MKRLEIAYLTSTDPRNKRSWSGTHYYVWKALEKNLGNVDLLGPAEPRLTLLYCKIIHAFSLYILGRRFNFRHSVILSRAYARMFGKKLKNKHYDLIVAPAGATYIAFLKTDIPVFYFSDATTANSLNYHLALSSLIPSSRKQSLLIEQKAIDMARFVSYPSKWAVDSALNDFHAAPRKVFQLPFGTNLDRVPTRGEALQPKQNRVCKLLFLAVYWENKGGPVAYDALLALLEEGIDVELTVAGCIPPPEKFNHPKLKVIPFLDKGIPAEYARLEELFRESHFFLLPTRFEAFCMGFSEAWSFALPVVTSNTGGLGSHVVEGKSGFLLPPEAGGKDYAETILKVWKDQQAYEQLRVSSRDLYENARNWDVWTKGVQDMLSTDPSFRS